MPLDGLQTSTETLPQSFWEKWHSVTGYKPPALPPDGERRDGGGSPKINLMNIHNLFHCMGWGIGTCLSSGFKGYEQATGPVTCGLLFGVGTFAVQIAYNDIGLFGDKDIAREARRNARLGISNAVLEKKAAENASGHAMTVAVFTCAAIMTCKALVASALPAPILELHMPSSAQTTQRALKGISAAPPGFKDWQP